MKLGTVRVDGAERVAVGWPDDDSRAVLLDRRITMQRLIVDRPGGRARRRATAGSGQRPGMAAAGAAAGQGHLHRAQQQRQRRPDHERPEPPGRLHQARQLAARPRPADPAEEGVRPGPPGAGAGGGHRRRRLGHRPRRRARARLRLHDHQRPDLADHAGRGHLPLPRDPSPAGRLGGDRVRRHLGLVPGPVQGDRRVRPDRPVDRDRRQRARPARAHRLLRPPGARWSPRTAPPT